MQEQSKVEELRTVRQATAQNWREGKKRAVFSFPVSKRRLEWLHLQHDGKQLNGKSLSCHEEHLDLSYANLDPQLQRLLATEGATANAFEDANEIWCRTVTIACNYSELLEVKVQGIKRRRAIERLHERIGHLRSHGLSWEDIYNLYAQPGPQCEHWRNLVAFCQRCIDVEAYLSFQHDVDAAVARYRVCGKQSAMSNWGEVFDHEFPGSELSCGFCATEVAKRKWDVKYHKNHKEFEVK